MFFYSLNNIINKKTLEHVTIQIFNENKCHFSKFYIPFNDHKQ